MPQHKTGSKVLFYMATPPSVFGLISDKLEKAGLNDSATGWKRIIVEKPFGTDLNSALALNKEILTYWREDQVYRIDHYLGKETVQNIIAFRFSNGMFEPLWNRNFVNHIQFTVAETVGVEGRGGYYDKSGGTARHAAKPHVSDAGLSLHGAAGVVRSRIRPQ